MNRSLLRWLLPIFAPLSLLCVYRHGRFLTAGNLVHAEGVTLQLYRLPGAEP